MTVQLNWWPTGVLQPFSLGAWLQMVVRRRLTHHLGPRLWRRQVRRRRLRQDSHRI